MPYDRSPPPRDTGLHIHLDPIGGVAGDMFVACMMQAFPQDAADAVAAAEALSGVACALRLHRDAVLAGAVFDVDDAPTQGHAHTDWRVIRARLDGSVLSGAVKQHATGIFQALAEAEARVHGVAVEDVAFHEVGSADSLADIVAAAVMIDAAQTAAGGVTWSVGPLPMGAGTVRGAHGVLPVPAPATSLLLEGFAFVDDGLPGERVTPTGAAILRYLGAGMTRPAGVLRASGIGFGSRVLAGRSNILRALVFDTPVVVAAGAAHRELVVIGFEVDDQSPEDLAMGIDRLRGMAGVHDVLQMPAYGKKGRITTHVQVLARPDLAEAIVEACFIETTTIGLRTHLVKAQALGREMREVTVDGSQVRVKRVRRPGGATGKAEADDMAKLQGQAARVSLRRRAEALAEAGTNA